MFTGRRLVLGLERDQYARRVVALSNMTQGETGSVVVKIERDATIIGNGPNRCSSRVSEDRGAIRREGNVIIPRLLESIASAKSTALCELVVSSFNPWTTQVPNNSMAVKATGLTSDSIPHARIHQIRIPRMVDQDPPAH